MPTGVDLLSWSGSAFAGLTFFKAAKWLVKNLSPSELHNTVYKIAALAGNTMLWLPKLYPLAKDAIKAYFSVEDLKRLARSVGYEMSPI
jgi:hypothetical protein